MEHIFTECSIQELYYKRQANKTNKNILYMKRTVYFCLYIFKISNGLLYVFIRVDFIVIFFVLFIIILYTKHLKSYTGLFKSKIVLSICKHHIL